MYGVEDYDYMFTDQVRTRAYLAAIAQQVHAGDVVVEIGTGLGYFAVAACRAGAGRVYAIETNPAIALGEEVADANGCADRITFVRGDSTRVTLPERGDILLSDLRGVLPMHEAHIASVADARARHVRPGARLIPAGDTLWAAPAEADGEFGRRHIDPGAAPHGIDRRVIEARLRETWHRVRICPEALLAAPAQWAAIDYATVTSPDVTGHAAWTIERAGILKGLCVWFDAALGPGCGFSNAPGANVPLYGQAFFPLRRAVDVAAGDHVAVDMRALLVDGEYAFAWDTTIVRAADSPDEGVVFRQSTLGAIAPLGRLRGRRDDHRPRPGRSTALLTELVALADGARTLGEIADALHDAHPARFTTRQSALRYASSRLAALEDEDTEHPCA